MAHHTFYVGPYLACQDKEIEVVKKTKKCKSLDCPNFNQTLSEAIFCPKCGKPLQEEENKYKTWLSFVEDEKWYELEESLDSGEINILEYRDADKNRIVVATDIVRIDEYTTILLSDDKMPNFDQEKQQFAERYAKQIEILKSIFGEDKVQVKWGVIQNLG